MGFRFRRSKKILPGVRLNLNKKSIGLTFGGKGFKYTINSSGRRTASVGIPGTGLSYSTSSGGKKGTTKRKPKRTNPPKATAKESATIEGQFTQVHESTNAIQPVDNGMPPPPQDGAAGPKGKGPGCSGCLIWIASVFLLFSGLVYFPSATSLLCLAAGLLILPIRRWGELMEGFIPVPGKMRAAIAIVFFVLSVMFYANPDTAPASATATASATPAPTISATAEPTETPVASTTPKPTATASPTPTAAPTATPDPTATPEPTETPTPTPAPTSEPAPDPTPEATAYVEMVWIPTNGGTKYHRRSGCSQMIDPIQVTKDEAIARGFTPCGRCY